MFSASTIAQMAAVFAKKEGGRINVLKLAKLLYLADRASIARYGSPISHDRFVSMEHGPVLSNALDLADGKTRSEEWSTWIKPRRKHDVAVARDFERDDLSHLSDADLEVLDEVYKDVGWMDRFELRDYTHKHCPEWKDPGKSSLPIRIEDIFLALGLADTEARSMAQTVLAERRLDRVFGHG